jgi:hypothetical protein
VSNAAQAASAELHEEALVKPPKPARTAFMCFSDAKQKEFMADGATQKKELIKRVADAWKHLSPKVHQYHVLEIPVSLLCAYKNSLLLVHVCRSEPFGMRKLETISSGTYRMLDALMCPLLSRDNHCKLMILLRSQVCSSKSRLQGTMGPSKTSGKEASASSKAPDVGLSQVLANEEKASQRG